MYLSNGVDFQLLACYYCEAIIQLIQLAIAMCESEALTLELAQLAQFAVLNYWVESGIYRFCGMHTGQLVTATVK